MTTCSCNQSVYFGGDWRCGNIGYQNGDAMFCMYCGDKLLPTGEVVSYAELQRKAEALDRLEPHIDSITRMGKYAPPNQQGLLKLTINGGPNYVIGDTLLALAEALPSVDPLPANPPAPQQTQASRHSEAPEQDPREEA